MTLMNLIPVGNKKRITSAEISEKLNISGAEVRSQIHNLRTQNVPIASDGNGYYIATNPSDLEHTIASLNSRISKMIAVRESLKKSQEKMKA